jgi:hypothetical protein
MTTQSSLTPEQCCYCRANLTAEEIEYYGVSCNKCESQNLYSEGIQMSTNPEKAVMSSEPTPDQIKQWRNEWDNVDSLKPEHRQLTASNYLAIRAYQAGLQASPPPAVPAGEPVAYPSDDQITQWFKGPDGIVRAYTSASEIANAAIDWYRARPSGAVPVDREPTARWNFDATDTDILVCHDMHEKGESCEFERMHPAEVLKLLNTYRSRILRIEAALEAFLAGVKG